MYSVQICFFWMPGLALVLLGISLAVHHLFFETAFEANYKKAHNNYLEYVEQFFSLHKEPHNKGPMVCKIATSCHSSVE